MYYENKGLYQIFVIHNDNVYCCGSDHRNPPVYVHADSEQTNVLIPIGLRDERMVV